MSRLPVIQLGLDMSRIYKLLIMICACTLTRWDFHLKKKKKKSNNFHSQGLIFIIIRPPRTSTGWSCRPEQLTTFSLSPTVQTVISTFQVLAPGHPYGPLTEDHQCCMSILRNGHALKCHYFCNFQCQF